MGRAACTPSHYTPRLQGNSSERVSKLLKRAQQMVAELGFNPGPPGSKPDAVP